MKKPVLLMILDGYALTEQTHGNAIAAANTPNLDRLMASYPNTLIGASGLDVGLPDGQMGNSEVGHTNMGAGRVVYQELTRISKAIADGDFFENPALVRAMENAKEKNAALQLIGLISDGGVHSHGTHLSALLRMAKDYGLEKVYVHCFMDGRDVSPKTGKGYIARLEEEMRSIGVGKIATVIGRYYPMDRDARWDRVEQAYATMVYGEGAICSDAQQIMQDSYDAGLTDEFVLPTVCDQHGMISDGDSVVFFNFRPDRARQITRALADPDFNDFARRSFPRLCYVCMTQYDATMPNVLVAFRPQNLSGTFGEYLSQQGLTQLRIAETEKYAHVTFFFSCGVEQPYEGEDRVLIPSPKVATYDLKPEMSAFEVTDEMLGRLDTGMYDVIILNYANCDMIGHTGVFEATVKATEVVDTCVGRVIDKVLALGGAALITSDHGNADQMYEADGSPFTAHTASPVPVIAVGVGAREMLPPMQGKLADLAPTLLDIMGLPKPGEMTGRSLLV